MKALTLLARHFFMTIGMSCLFTLAMIATRGIDGGSIESFMTVAGYSSVIIAGAVAAFTAIRVVMENIENTRVLKD